ncbi:hypothetical protein COCOBI_02-0670 [Coccomyxa sp. Obi]|nr:hypothetical protein COCOBI_02-0670 [Coccomyxa sp. Obi]
MPVFRRFTIINQTDNASLVRKTILRKPWARRLPCSHPPMRRRGGIISAAASPTSPAADDSKVVANVGPFLLTRQDCIRYIVPAAALCILTSCLDGKGLLLLAQGTVMVMAAAAVTLAFVTTMATSAKRMWEGSLLSGAMEFAYFGCIYSLLVYGFSQRFIVPITLSYPFCAGTLPVLAPAAALFIKQHPAVAAGCYSAAKGIPYALCIAAAVAIVRRAAARMLAASALPSKAAGLASGTGGSVVARDTSMPEAITALQAENSRLRTRLDDIAKRLGAVEDCSGDDEAQHRPLRRVGEVEDKLAQVARLLVTEIEDLKVALPSQSQMGAIVAQLEAADARHAQLKQELAGKADAGIASEQEARITESLQQVSALRQQLLELSAAQEADSERLDGADWALEDLKVELQIGEYVNRDGHQEPRLDKIERRMAALQRSCEEAAAAAAAAASGGNTFQARLFLAEDRIKGLACLVEQGLSNSEGDIAELKRRLDCCAAGQEDTNKNSMEQWRHASEEEIEALTWHVGGHPINVDGEDCLEDRACRANEQLSDLKETAKETGKEEALAWGELEARVKQAEDEIGGLKFELYGDIESEYGTDEGDVVPRLTAAEREIKRLKELTSNHDTAQQGSEQLAKQVKSAQNQLKYLWELLGLKRFDEASGTHIAVARLDDAEGEIAALKEYLGIVDGGGVSRIEEAEGMIDSLKPQQYFSAMNEAVMKSRQQAEDKISELTAKVDELTSAAQATPQKTATEISPESEGIPEEKWREWLERGVPKSEWQRLWLKESEERSETGPDDTYLEQKLQEIKSSLHSELRGDCWGLDIQGFHPKDTAADNKTAQQVVIEAEHVPEGLGQQPVKPRPAPEPEKAREMDAEEVVSRLEDAEDLIGILQKELIGRSDYDSVGDDILSRLADAERYITRLEKVTCNHETAQQGAKQLAEKLKYAEDRVQSVWDLLAPCTQSALAMLDVADAKIEALMKLRWGVYEKRSSPLGLVARLQETQQLVTHLQGIVADNSKAQQEVPEDQSAALKQLVFESYMKEEDVRDRLANAQDKISELEQVYEQCYVEEYDPQGDEAQVVIEAENVPEGSGLQLVRPRPAPEPEKAREMDGKEVVSRLEDAEDLIGMLQKEMVGQSDYDCGGEDNVFARLAVAQRYIARLQMVTCNHETAQAGTGQLVGQLVGQLTGQLKEQLTEQLKDAQGEIQAVWDLLAPWIQSASLMLDDAEAKIDALMKLRWGVDEGEPDALTLVARLEETQQLVTDLQGMVPEISKAEQDTILSPSWRKDQEDEVAACEQQYFESWMNAEDVRKRLKWAQDKIGELKPLVDELADEEQVKAPAENVSEGSGLQLVKPWPAPKPEKATVIEPEQAGEEEASNALDR